MKHTIFSVGLFASLLIFRSCLIAVVSTVYFDEYIPAGHACLLLFLFGNLMKMLLFPHFWWPYCGSIHDVMSPFCRIAFALYQSFPWPGILSCELCVGFSMLALMFSCLSGCAAGSGLSFLQMVREADHGEGIFSTGVNLFNSFSNSGKYYMR